jgi:hypothetical protein
MKVHVFHTAEKLVASRLKWIIFTYLLTGFSQAIKSGAKLAQAGSES